MASQNVNNEACGMCHMADHMDHSIMCDGCKKWIHYYCTKLPIYILKCFAKSTRKFDCKMCSNTKYVDIEWDAVAQANIVKQGIHIKSTNSNITQTSSGLENEESHPGTPKPLEEHESQGIGSSPEDANLSLLTLSQEELTDNTHIPAGQGDPAPVSANHHQRLNNTELPLTDPSHTAQVTTQSHLTPTENLPQANAASQASPNSSLILSATSSPEGHRHSQLKICRFYKRNNCKHGILGTHCNFDHPKPCPKLMKFGLEEEKGCRLGARCDHYHPRMCRNSLRKGICLNTQCRFTHKKGTRRETVAGDHQDHVALTNNLHRQTARIITETHSAGINLRNTKEEKTHDEAQQRLENRDTFLGQIQELRREMHETFKMQMAELRNQIAAMNISQINTQVRGLPPTLPLGYPHASPRMVY